MRKCFSAVVVSLATFVLANFLFTSNTLAWSVPSGELNCNNFYDTAGYGSSERYINGTYHEGRFSWGGDNPPQSYNAYVYLPGGASIVDESLSKTWTWTPPSKCYTPAPNDGSDYSRSTELSASNGTRRSAADKVESYFYFLNDRNYGSGGRGNNIYSVNWAAATYAKNLGSDSNNNCAIWIGPYTYSSTDSYTVGVTARYSSG